MWRSALLIMLITTSSAAWSLDPILILLLRMVRDQAITASLEAGVGALSAAPPPSAPTFGYAMPGAAIEKGHELEHLRTTIDDSFLHLNSAQRAAVYSGIQKILEDPQYAAAKAQIIADFALKAASIRAGFRQLDRLSRSEKRAIAAQASAEFQRLPPEERSQLLEVMNSGMLPVPRDLNDMMVAEFTRVASAASGPSRLE